MRLRLRADEFCVVVDDDLRHGVDVVSFGEIRKLAGLDDIGRDPGTVDREERGQPGRARAVRSSRRDKNLNVRVVLQPAQNLVRLHSDGRFGLRDGDDQVEERTEFIAAGDPEVSDAEILGADHSGSGGSGHPERAGRLGLGRETMHVERDFWGERSNFHQDLAGIFGHFTVLPGKHQPTGARREKFQCDGLVEFLLEPRPDERGVLVSEERHATITITGIPVAAEFAIDFKVLEHLRGYPDELKRYSNLIKQVHPRGMSAVEFLLKRPSAADDFVALVCRLVRDGEEIMSVVEAAEAAGLEPKAFLAGPASDPEFPQPLFRKDHKAVWRRADVEVYLAHHADRNG